MLDRAGWQETIGEQSRLQDFAEQIRKKVLEEMDLGRDYTDEEIRDMIELQVKMLSRGAPMTITDRIQLEEDAFHALRGLDILQRLIDDPEITEVLVNGPKAIFYEKEGRLYRYPKVFSSDETLENMIQNIVGRHNRVVNQSSPIVDTRLEDGSRVNIVLAPIAIDGSAVSIRKFPKEPMKMRQLIELGSIDSQTADWLELLVRARYNIFISGGTGSGKTTFLNALSQFIPKEERIITIEDSAELQLQEQENLVRLETRNANFEGVHPISIRDLIRTALRMRPDRIIVGECRGEEALDMLAAMNTGHDGSLSTGHANSCRDMLQRLATMVIMGKELPLAAVQNQLASGIDVIIQLGRLRDKSRRVLEIVEVDGVKDGEICLHTLFRFEEESVQDRQEASDVKSTSDGKFVSDGLRVKGRLVQTGQLLHREKLQAAGLEEAAEDGL